MRRARWKDDEARLTRRGALFVLGALPLSANSARADDGALPQTFRIPSELYPSSLPGVVMKGATTAEIKLYEFFDYNCAYCRKAAREVDEVIATNPDLQVGLVNNPILSVGSVQAAKVQQAILRLYGPTVAYAFHQRMIAKRGQSDGASALGIAREMALDATKVEESADSVVVAGVLRRQADLAASLDMSMTPSFAIVGFGFLGWPGKKALQTFILNARNCERPICDGKG